MSYVKLPSGHFDRGIILLQYIVREAFLAVRYDRQPVHTRSHTLSVTQRLAGIFYAQHST